MTIKTRQAALALAVAAAFTSGYALHDRVGIGAAAAGPVAAPAATIEAPAATVSLPDFSTIAAQEGPAVVNISVSGTSKAGIAEMPDFDPNGPFGEFFKRFGIPGFQGHFGPHGRIPTHGLGSGFIISPDGIILTNAHVVADADEVMVKLTDKREFKAKVIGFDKATDVAVLRIKASGLPTVKIGDPAKARVGEWVMAIGSPFGFENSVTAGIISAKSRTLPDENYVPFMQTDVAVNPGNSGGPLIDAKGEVIGINSQIYSQSGGYQGLSFAIPIDVAMNVEQQLLAHGKVSRGRIGVTVQEVDQGLAESFGLDKPRGALVNAVDAGSPAAKAGIEPGDVILKFNGKDIARSSDLPSLVGGLSPGTKATIEVWRNGSTKEFTVAVGEMNNALASSEGSGAQHEAAGGLGLAVRPLTPDERAQVAGGAGLVVEDAGDGAAARAGIESGDVILSANGERMGNVAQLRNQIKRSSKYVALLVQRGDQRMFVPVPLG
ncbi:MAG TPA: DegQ family serine endoprotease [Rhodocyclaceae bacterium]|nr:DegQ family serine endoprotease [Rhodocyclaceae bacterium]